MKFLATFLNICMKNGEIHEKCKISAKFAKRRTTIFLTKNCYIAEIGPVQKNAHLVDPFKSFLRNIWLQYLVAKFGFKTTENVAEHEKVISLIFVFLIFDPDVSFVPSSHLIFTLVTILFVRLCYPSKRTTAASGIRRGVGETSRSQYHELFKIVLLTEEISTPTAVLANGWCPSDETRLSMLL